MPLLLLALALYVCIELWVPNVRDPIFSVGRYTLTWVELIYLVTFFLAMFELLRVSQPGIDNTVEALLMLGVSGIMLVLFVLGVAGLPACQIFNRMEFLMLLLISAAQVILAFLINARTLKRTIDYAASPWAPDNEQHRARQISVAAYNTAKESENKIHDDAVAQRFGFRGGLVPGVDVYAYMTHLPVEAWGRAWLERGRADCQFLKPVYEGKTAIVTGERSEAAMTLEVTVEGELCASGSAALRDTPAAVPDVASFAEASPPELRPVADETSLAAGRWLGMRPLLVTGEFAENYLRDVRETDLLYARESIVHPGMILRTCNWLLTHNVVLARGSTSAARSATSPPRVSARR